MPDNGTSAPAPTAPVPAWNVLVTLSEPTFRIARKLLSRWGTLRRTDYHNVEVMAVADPAAFVREFAAAVEQEPGILNAVSHVVPLEHAFTFKDAADFERRARELALSYLPKLAGKAFHVRLHRRGLKSSRRLPKSGYSMTLCSKRLPRPGILAAFASKIPIMSC